MSRLSNGSRAIPFPQQPFAEHEKDDDPERQPVIPHGKNADCCFGPFLRLKIGEQVGDGRQIVRPAVRRLSRGGALDRPEWAEGMSGIVIKANGVWIENLTVRNFDRRTRDDSANSGCRSRLRTPSCTTRLSEPFS